MGDRSNSPPAAAATKDLVQKVILQASRGEILSVKETIAEIRRDSPYLLVTDDELVYLIVSAAPAFGMAVAFDLHE